MSNLDSFLFLHALIFDNLNIKFAKDLGLN